MATYTRQCGSRKQALEEIFQIQNSGRWTSEIVVVSKNVYEYSAECLETKESPAKPHIWIRLDSGCPECGKYEEDRLDWLAENLVLSGDSNWENDSFEEQKQVKEKLLAMPVGKMVKFYKDLIVRVESE